MEVECVASACNTIVTRHTYGMVRSLPYPECMTGESRFTRATDQTLGEWRRRKQTLLFSCIDTYIDEVLVVLRQELEPLMSIDRIAIVRTCDRRAIACSRSTNTALQVFRDAVRETWNDRERVIVHIYDNIVGIVNSLLHLLYVPSFFITNAQHAEMLIEHRLEVLKDAFRLSSIASTTARTTELVRQVLEKEERR